MRFLGLRMLGATAGLALLASGCASAQVVATSTGAPEPGASTPSTVSAMICRSEAIQEIGSAVGAKAVVSTPTWIDHLYSCKYGYPSGSMQLSVKELSNQAQTDAYFHQLGVQLGDTGALPNLGQGAFQTTNGSIVVRKDSKVLLVDVSSLPAQFGQPPTTAGNVALTVADVILGCWSGD